MDNDETEQRSGWIGSATPLSRRRVLAVAATAGVAGGVGRLVGAQQDGTGIELIGRAGGWEGVAPAEIEGETNPTLGLVAGREYAVTWENGDGVPHDFRIETADGEDVVDSDDAQQEGQTVTVEFTATEEMAEYYCSYHPQSMRGEVQVAEGTPTETPTPEETPTETETPEETPTEAPGPAVQVRSHPDHGDILVGPDGSTLYMFEQDTQGEGASACYDDCAEAWPPLTVEGEPTAGEEVTADLTTFEREDGSMQVAADGWPLYYFAGDEQPGDATGQGVNDVWWVLAPDGAPMRPDAPGEDDGFAEDREFTATLAGENEVPPVETDATGEAHFETADHGEGPHIHYRLAVEGPWNGCVTQAHIHVGGPDENGPVVAFLFEADEPVVDAEGTLAEGTVTADDLLGPLEGEDLGALVDEMDAGNAYVNVHTTQHPPGEIRGQIESAG